MPKGFNNCRSKGGKIITKRVNKEQYIHICYLGDKSYPGEIKKYKKIFKK